MKKYESQLLKHILNEKYLGEEEKPAMSKDEKKAFLEAVSQYHKLGEMVYRESNLRELSETLGNIVTTAEGLTIQESEHWFDNVTVSRHMKQLSEAFKTFEKTAGEMSGMQQLLEAAYEDIGTVLNKYYTVNNSLER